MLPKNKLCHTQSMSCKLKPKSCNVGQQLSESLPVGARSLVPGAGSLAATLRLSGCWDIWAVIGLWFNQSYWFTLYMGFPILKFKYVIFKQVPKFPFLRLL